MSRLSQLSTYVASLAQESSDPSEGGLVGFVTDLMEWLGAPGAGLAVALENLFPPIPSEVILPLAGFTASQGKMNLFAVIVWTTIGSVVGAMALYYIGVALGRDRVRAIAARLPLVKLSDVDRTEAWFIRHGAKAVFFGRMIPIFRSLISIPAGVERMPIPTFLLYTTLGSLIWNTVFVMAGYLLGESWHTVEAYAGTFQKIVIVVGALAVAGFVIARVVKARRGQPATDGDDVPPDGDVARPGDLARPDGDIPRPDFVEPYPPEAAVEPYTQPWAGTAGHATRGTVYGSARVPAHGAGAAPRGTLYGTPRRPADDH
ncbi:DedA family protein [Polymorphospora sp. NPDC051019]|uniref:DedA family protein n=1 Tax=Polymorphospora sp. NPDC051019 TaxID=3155725 RepID=UPI003424096A